MTNFYELSPSSMQTFQRIIELSDQKTTRNKWNERFSRKSVLIGYEHITNSLLSHEDINIGTPQDNENAMEIVEEADCDVKTVNYEQYKELLESNTTHIKYILEDSLKYPSILQSLASKISDTYIEKICQYIFEGNLELKLTESFIQNFLPTYLKRQNTWLSIEILVKVFKTYPVQFKLLLQIIIQDSDINVSILQEYVSTLNLREQTEIFKLIMDLDLSVNDLIRYLFTIHTLYKNSIKDEKIQNSILIYLKDLSEKCANDKQYGRLLLLYLQNKNDSLKLDVLEKLIDGHRSAFKRPCLNAFREIIEKYT